jgi:cell division septum initiation protein DivIVA
MNSLTTKQTPPPFPAPQFETVMRGYDARQVHEYVEALRGEFDKLRHALGEGGERLLHAAETPQGERAIVDLMKIAVDEIEGNQAAAAAQVAQELADARAEAAQVRESANKEASSLVAGARQQAATVLSTARADAKKLTDRASAEAAAVHEGAGRRMEGLRAVHDETLRRMTEIREVMDRTLGAEGERGTLDDEVERALAGTSAVAATAPSQLTAVPTGT